MLRISYGICQILDNVNEICSELIYFQKRKGLILVGRIKDK
jgi:hypothetical protein